MWPPPPPEGPVHRSLDGLAAALTVLLAAAAAAALAASAESALAASFRAAGELTAVLLYLPLIPVFLVWFYRARKNADGRGQEQRWGPGWTIGGWVVPVINLFFPFQIMAGIWRANLPAEQRAKTTWLLGSWWGCWIAGGVSSSVAVISAGAAPGLTRIGLAVSHLLTAAAAILLIVIARAISRGPVGREPVTAQPGPVPPDSMTPGPAYPPLPGDGHGRNRRAAGVGYALSAVGVVVIAALTAGAYVLPPRTAPVAARTPTPTAAATPAATPAALRLTVDQLRAGDCIQGPPNINTRRNWPNLVSVVPCRERHLAEVFYSANYWPETKAFPGNPVIFRQATAKCRKTFLFYDGIHYAYSKYTGYGSLPVGRQDWNSGDRQLVCIAFYWTSKVPRGKPLFASIKGSNQ
jgi:Domain of unknown function (DUF4328)